MNAESLEIYDHPPFGANGRRGVCHISDVLPVVLARIATMAPNDMDGPPKPVDAAPRPMPLASTPV